jgi:hypothetical protein
MTTKKGTSKGKAPAQPKAATAPAEKKAAESITPPGETKLPEETKAPKAEKKNNKEFPHAKRAKEIFATHKIDVIYFTSDGQVFIEPQHARMHADRLKDQKITPIKREEV